MGQGGSVRRQGAKPAVCPASGSRRDLGTKAQERTKNANALVNSLAPPHPPRRPGSGSDEHGSSLLLPRGRARQMPTWQRLGLAVPPRRPGQGRSPRGRWSLGPRVRVRQAVAEQLVAGRGSGSLVVQKGSSLRRERTSRVDRPMCVCGGGWGGGRVCWGRGKDHSEGDEEVPSAPGE